MLIDALNGRNSALDLLDQHRNERVAVSIISLGEIFDGAIGARDPERHLAEAQGFLEPYPVVQLSRTILVRLAQLRVELRRSGRLIPDFDPLIAATALEHGLTLVTNNPADYQDVPGLQLQAARISPS